MSSTLEADFNKAVARVNSSNKSLPPDTMLKLYALYKIATKNQENPSGDKPLINAFKANALFQAKHMSIETAMLKYITIVEKEAF
ncbi:acyl-CoA-binding protein [Flavobacteriaceae bacterium]|nr:acyl-CoA-binding protein [Flavobacteriaceae bacterium]